MISKISLIKYNLWSKLKIRKRKQLMSLLSEVQALFLFADKGSLLFITLNALVYLKKRYIYIFLYAERLFFLFILCIVMAHKYRVDRVGREKHQVVPFYALYLFLYVPIFCQIFSRLGFSLLYSLCVLFGILSFLPALSVTSFWVLSGGFGACLVGNISLANGFIVSFLSILFFIRQLNNIFIGPHFVIQRLFFLLMSTATAFVFLSDAFLFLCAGEVFITFFCPVIIYLLYQRKIEEKKRVDATRKEIMKEIPPSFYALQKAVDAYPDIFLPFNEE